MNETGNETFKQDISVGKTLIEIYNPGCAPCAVMQKVIIPEVEGEVNAFALDASANMRLIQELQPIIGNIMSVPVLLLFENGNFVRRRNGLVNVDDLREFIR